MTPSIRQWVRRVRQLPALTPAPRCPLCGRLVAPKDFHPLGASCNDCHVERFNVVWDDDGRDYDDDGR